LIAVAGETANAIELFLARIAYILPVRSIRQILTMAPYWRKAFAFRRAVNCRTPGCRLSALWKWALGVDKTVPWDARRLS
jgi:hypothetical protein